MAQRTIGWGLLATGNIAGAFAGDLPKSETGRLVACASRDLAKAQAFANKFGIPKALGSYEELLADPEVEAVYVSTPHPFHAQWTIRACEAGKHVLCEKPIGLNAPEAEAMLEAALKHKVLLMEAYMYRCSPQTAKLVELLRDGAIGELRTIQAVFSFASEFNPNARLFNNALGGGGILDVGGYPMSFARLLAGAVQGKPFADPSRIEAVGKLHPETGVDLYASAICEWADSPVVAELACGVGLARGITSTLFGSEGKLTVDNPWFPAREAGKWTLRLDRKGAKEPELIEADESRPIYAHEADAVGRALLAGQHETPEMPWDDTLGNARALDQWRREIGLEYESEKPTAPVPTVHRRPVSRNPEANLPYGEINGVGKPICRLVMGGMIDRSLPAASYLYDDYFERGGNAFDTAWVYSSGRSEALLGHWQENRGIREQIVLIAKGAHSPLCYPEYIHSQLDQSLQRLRTNYADIYFMHRDNPEVPIGEFVDALDAEVARGRIRAFGGSNWSRERVDAANAYARQHGKRGFAAISNQFSLARMVEPLWHGCISSAEPEFRAWHEQTQMPLFAWSSQARGFFTERANDPNPPDELLSRCFYSKDNFERRARVYQLAEKKGVLPLAIASAYILAQPFPFFGLIGPRAIAEVRTSLTVATVQLTPEEAAWLNLKRESL